MNEEKLKILQMLEEKKITAAEAMELLNAIEETAPKKKATGSSHDKKFLRIRVSGEKTKKVNVNIPLSLLKVASKFATLGMGCIPEEARKQMEQKGIDLSQLDVDELVNAIEQGVANDSLVDVDVDDPKEGHVRVEIYVD